VSGGHVVTAYLISEVAVVAEVAFAKKIRGKKWMHDFERAMGHNVRVDEIAP
jgi:hypothetical protein